MNLEERKINILNLILNVCLKWKLMLIAGAIGLVLTSVYSVVKFQSGAGQSAAFADMPIVLNEREMEEINMFMMYDDAYRECVADIQSDRLLTCNPLDMYCASVEYMISGVAEADVIAGALSGKIMLNRKEHEFSMFTTAECVNYDNNIVNVVNGDDVKSGTDVAVLKIMIYEENEAACRDSVEAMKAFVQDNSEELKKVFGNFETVLIMNDTAKYGGDLLRSYINAKKENEWSKFGSRNTVYNVMTPTVKKAIDSDNYIGPDEEIDNELYEKAVSSVSIKDMLDIKMAIVGFAAGILLVAGIYTVLYLVGGYILFESDDLAKTGTEILGKIPADKKRFIIDEWLTRLLRRQVANLPSEEMLALTVSKIKVACKRDGVDKLYLAGTLMGESEKAIAEKISNRLADVDIIVTSGNSVINDSESFEKMAETGSVVFIEKAGKSEYYKIIKLMRDSRQNKINVLGIVVVD